MGSGANEFDWFLIASNDLKCRQGILFLHFSLTSLNRDFMTATNKGWVVRKTLNANPGLQSTIFSCLKMFFTAYGLGSLK